MRILMVADLMKNPDSGSAGTVYRTTGALRELGHEVDEVWGRDLPHRIRHGNLHFLLERPRAYRDAVRQRTMERDYDVIQVSHAQGYLAARDHRRRRRPGVFVSRSHGVEVRVEEAMSVWRARLGVQQKRTLRSVLRPVLRRLLARHWPQLVRHCDGIIVGCSMDRDFLIERYDLDPDRVEAIAHGVCVRHLERPVAPMSSERLRRVLYAGQFNFLKGPHVLARVLNAFLPRHPEVRFTWVCKGADHAAVRGLLAPEAAGRIEFRDWMPQDVLMDVYDAHGIFIFPSLFEGFGKAPIEAMARGACVVTSNVGGMRDVIRDGESGFLVEPGNAEGFVARVEWLLANPDAARRMAAAGRRVAEGLTWRRCAERAVAFYRRLLAAKARGSAAGGSGGRA